MKITEVRYHIVNVPYLQPETWAFGRTDGATSAIVEVEADTGLVGYGELPGMPNIALAVEALKKTIPLAIGHDPSNIKQFLRATWIDGWHHFPYTGNVATAALEMAMWDLVGKSAGLPLYHFFGGLQSTSVPYYYYIPIMDRRPDTARREAAEGVARGFRTIYIKIGPDVDNDVAIAAAIRAEVGSDVAIRVDPNEAWTPLQARYALTRFAEIGIECVEEPVDMNNSEALADLRSHSPVPICANQSAWLLHQIPRLIANKSCDMIATDPHQLGSLQSFRDVAAMCDIARIPLIKHSFGDLGLTTAATLHILGGLTPPILAHQTHLNIVEHDLLKPQLEFKDGSLSVPSGPGIGVELDWDAIAHYKAIFERNGEFPGGYSTDQWIRRQPT